ELLHAAPMDEIEVDVEHDGNLRSAADCRHGLQELRRGGPGFQAALCRKLVDQSIRQRVAEGDTQLQHIDAELIERQRQLSRGFEVRVARAKVNDESSLALPVQPGESFYNAIHAVAECPKRPFDSTV